MMKRMLAGGLVLGACVAAVPHAAQSPHVASLYVTVTDSDGRLVPNLVKEDFAVYEDGQPVRVVAFSSEPPPLSVVLLLDRSNSMEEVSGGALSAAGESLIRQLRPSDRMRIATFSDRIRIAPPEFTSSQQLLVETLRARPPIDGPTALWNALAGIIDMLSEQHGHRVVLALSDGVDGVSNVTFPEVMNGALLASVTVYAIAADRLPFGAPRRAERSRRDLERLASETGGSELSAGSAGQLKSGFVRIAEELHGQYSLRFEPAKLDGKRHKLEVTIKKPGMKARARKSHVAVKE